MKSFHQMSQQFKMALIWTLKLVKIIRIIFELLDISHSGAYDYCEYQHCKYCVTVYFIFYVRKFIWIYYSWKSGLFKTIKILLEFFKISF